MVSGVVCGVVVVALLWVEGVVVLCVETSRNLLYLLVCGLCLVCVVYQGGILVVKDTGVELLR